jgi:hypothetical protein
VTRPLALAGLLLALVVASLTPSPAGAATAARPDRRGDAPAAIDITRLRVATSPGVVRFTLRVTELRARGTFVVGMSEPHGTGTIEYVVTRRQGRAQVATRLTDFDDTFAVDCPGARARWDARKDVITVRGPESCLYFAGDDRAWSVFASSRAGRARDRVDSFTVRRG